MTNTQKICDCGNLMDETGVCWPCLEVAVNTHPPGSPSRGAEARARGAAFYPDWCAEHGQQPFFAAGGACSKCQTKAGGPRHQTRNPARIQARHMNAECFMDHCPTHGFTKHWTTRGTCSTCTNRNGMMRSMTPRGRSSAPGAPQKRDDTPARRAAYEAVAATLEPPLDEWLRAAWREGLDIAGAKAVLRKLIDLRI